MKRLIIGGIATLIVGLGPAPLAHADTDTDCYTQSTYNGGTRTTCYSGYPDYNRTVVDCDGTGHCVIRSH